MNAFLIPFAEINYLLPFLLPFCLKNIQRRKLNIIGKITRLLREKLRLNRNKAFWKCIKRLFFLWCWNIYVFSVFLWLKFAIFSYSTSFSYLTLILRAFINAHFAGLSDPINFAFIISFDDRNTNESHYSDFWTIFEMRVMAHWAISSSSIIPSFLIQTHGCTFCSIDCYMMLYLRINCWIN